MAHQLRQVESVTGDAPVPEGQEGERLHTVDAGTDNGRLAIAVGTALVDIGFRLQSVNQHEQDVLGGVTIWPARGNAGVCFAWNQNYFMAIRWPRGDVNQLQVQDTMNESIRQVLSIMGFTLKKGGTGENLVVAAPAPYLTHPVLDQTAHVPGPD